MDGLRKGGRGRAGVWTIFSFLLWRRESDRRSNSVRRGHGVVVVVNVVCNVVAVVVFLFFLALTLRDG